MHVEAAMVGKQLPLQGSRHLQKEDGAGSSQGDAGTLSYNSQAQFLKSGLSWCDLSYPD